MDIREIRRSNLNRLLKDRFGTKKSALARAIGKADSYVHRLLLDPSHKHASAMGDAVAREIESRLELSAYLLDTLAKDAPPAPDPEIVLIPESEIRFSAGPGSTYLFAATEAGEPASYKSSFFRDLGINPQMCRRFRVRGDSMEPLLYDGDVILVNMAETRIVDGRVFAIRIGDELKVKRLRSKLNGTIVVESINPSYVNEEISPDALGSFQIIGRVRDKSGPGGL